MSSRVFGFLGLGNMGSPMAANIAAAGYDVIGYDAAGTKDRKVRSAVLPLKAGLHKISLRYNHRGGDMNFRFRYGIKGQGLTQAYGGEFVH